MTTKKQYIVTDPCYLLPEETWKKCCEELDKYEGVEQTEKFSEAVTKALQERFGKPAEAYDTGIGDWTNEIRGNAKIIQPNFFADAGMVCVCPVNEEIQQLINEFKGTWQAAAVFEMSDNVKIDIDVSNEEWTVVRVTDLNNGEYVTSLSYRDYDEEDEEYDNWNVEDEE